MQPVFACYGWSILSLIAGPIKKKKDSALVPYPGVIRKQVEKSTSLRFNVKIRECRPRWKDHHPAAAACYHALPQLDASLTVEIGFY